MFSKYLISQKERVLLVLATAAVPSLILHLFFSFILFGTAFSIYQFFNPPPPPDPSHFTIAACYFPAPIQVLFKWTTFFALLVTAICTYSRRIFLSFLTLLTPLSLALLWFISSTSYRVNNIESIAESLEYTPVYNQWLSGADSADVFFLTVILFLFLWHSKIILQDFIKSTRIVGKLP